MIEGVKLKVSETRPIRSARRPDMHPVCLLKRFRFDSRIKTPKPKKLTSICVHFPTPFPALALARLRQRRSARQLRRLIRNFRFDDRLKYTIPSIADVNPVWCLRANKEPKKYIVCIRSHDLLKRYNFDERRIELGEIERTC